MNLANCRQLRDLLSILLATCKSKGLNPDINVYDESQTVKVVIYLPKSEVKKP